MLSRAQPGRLSAQQRIAQALSLTLLDGLHDELIGIVNQLTGSAISLDAPLMSAGLDSIGATELSTRLNERLETELPSTLLFDHPSLRSIAGSLPTESGDSSAPETA
jgi:acyl carrier protein